MTGTDGAEPLRDGRRRISVEPGAVHRIWASLKLLKAATRIELTPELALAIRKAV